MRPDDDAPQGFRNIRKSRSFFEVPSNDAWLVWWTGVAVSAFSPVLALLLLLVAVLIPVMAKWLH